MAKGYMKNHFFGRCSIAWALASVSLASLPVSAQLEHVSSVMNGFGGRSTGGSFTHIGAGAQPGGISVSYQNGSSGYDGGWVDRAGFLNTFSLFPDRDMNGNGLDDELDPDNDADGLWDHWEVSGEQFSPNTPSDPNQSDTDDNGLSDFAEMVAGTDPTNPEAGFMFTAIEVDGAVGAVTWNARGNHERTYVLTVRHDSYDGIPDIVIWSNTVAGGVAPWYAVTNTVNEPLANGSYYAVEVIHP